MRMAHRNRCPELDQEMAEVFAGEQTSSQCQCVQSKIPAAISGERLRLLPIQMEIDGLVDSSEELLGGDEEVTLYQMERIK